MKIPKEELISILLQFNPWWKGEFTSGLPQWHRSIFSELFEWTVMPPAPRAVLLSGPRQIGKTTLVLQVIQELLNKHVPASNILYATFDHPIIKLAGVDAVIETWRELEIKHSGPEYLFLDEAQFIREWGTWIKHQVDFMKERRIIFTGSAMPLASERQESGVGRWHTIRLTTLSFYEYIKLKETNRARALEAVKKTFDISNFSTGNNFELWKNVLTSPELPELPVLESLDTLFTWDQTLFKKTMASAQLYLGHFNEYLLYGGFPQTAQMNSVVEAQKLLREDIIEKVLKRDMTALFGIRHILELEQVFIYLCMHPCGLLDMQKLCENLEVKRPTAQNFINILEMAHLIYKLPPYGYGKEVLRAKYKIYLADSSLAPAVLLSGKAVLESTEKLGNMIETAIFKHLYTYYRQKSVRFTYWQNSKKQEVDLVAELSDSIIPFEIKYREQHTKKKDLGGLEHFCKEKEINQGYIVTKEINDFGPHLDFKACNLMRIPAVLLCYWLGQMELQKHGE